MAGSNENGNPFNVWWFGAGALLVLVLVGGLFLVYVTRDGGEAEAEAPATSAAAPPQTSAPDSGCNVPAENQDYPVDAPETDWELYDNLFTLPVSNEFGPVKRDDELWQCFAHSPTGATFAGINLLIEFSGGQYEAAIDTPQAKSYFDDLPDSNSASNFTLLGYQITSYSETDAEIVYGTDYEGNNGVITVHITWDEEQNDWRLNLDAGMPQAEVMSSSQESNLTDWGPRNG